MLLIALFLLLLVVASIISTIEGDSNIPPSAYLEKDKNKSFKQGVVVEKQVNENIIQLLKYTLKVDVNGHIYTIPLMEKEYERFEVGDHVKFMQLEWARMLVVKVRQSKDS